MSAAPNVTESPKAVPDDRGALRRLFARFPITAYCLFAFPSQILIVLSQHYEIRNHGLSAVRIFIPAVSGILVAWLAYDRKTALKLVTSLFNVRVPLKYWAFALFYPSFVAIVALGGLYAIGVGEGLHIDLYEVRFFRFFFLTVKISASEEIGWVGFVTTVFASRYRLLHSSLFVGILWGLWYFPLVFADIQVVPGLPLGPLILHFMAIAAICAWLYQRTRSAAVVFLMQVTTNYTSQIIPVLPLRGGIPQYVAFVVIKTLFAIALYVFWGPKPMFGKMPAGTSALDAPANAEARAASTGSSGST
jgi:membrane protease YdiL (CAAX protease family)